MTGKVFVNHADGQADMTLEELRNLLQLGDTATCYRLFLFGSQLRGTAAWKRARRAELLDMMDAIGLPHFFITWSSAEPAPADVAAVRGYGASRKRSTKVMSY